jgi:hypothetical protein
VVGFSDSDDGRLKKGLITTAPKDGVMPLVYLCASTGTSTGHICLSTMRGYVYIRVFDFGVCAPQRAKIGVDGEMALLRPQSGANEADDEDKLVEGLVSVRDSSAPVRCWR